jgi:GNAT superfamily N-acetyltransferase
MNVRSATEADLEAIVAIALACGQPPTDSAADPPYVRHLLAHGTLLVAANGERGSILGFGATRMIGATSLLTDLFVSPPAQGEGIGRAILEMLWMREDESRVTFSSQHRSALPLYARFGLAPRWPLLYVTGYADQLGDSPLTARATSAKEAATFELELTGIDRRADYGYWLRNDTDGGIVVLSGSTPVAAAAATSEGIVHLACTSPARAADALVAALTLRADHSITVCLPGTHPGLALLLRRGFTIADFDLFMSTDDALLAATNAYSPSFA